MEKPPSPLIFKRSLKAALLHKGASQSLHKIEPLVLRGLKSTRLSKVPSDSQLPQALALTTPMGELAAKVE